MKRKNLCKENTSFFVKVSRSFFTCKIAETEVIVLTKCRTRRDYGDRDRRHRHRSRSNSLSSSPSRDRRRSRSRSPSRDRRRCYCILDAECESARRRPIQWLIYIKLLSWMLSLNRVTNLIDYLLQENKWIWYGSPRCHCSPRCSNPRSEYLLETG